MKKEHVKKKPSLMAHCVSSFSSSFVFGLGFSLAVGAAGIAIDAVVGRRT